MAQAEIRGLLEEFPFLFGGTFIEAIRTHNPQITRTQISLPFRRDFH